MQFKSNGVLVALVAVFAMSAVAVTSASAASFEYKFEGAGALAEESKVTEGIVFSGEGQPTIECSKVQIEKGVIADGGTTSTVKSIRFESCIDTTSPTKCVVSPIITKELTGTLVGEAKAVKERFRPVASSEIGTLVVKNKGEETCGSKVEMTITGEFTSSAVNDEVSQKQHTLKFNVSNGELNFAEKAATFKGGFEEGLQSGDVWSVV